MPMYSAIDASYCVRLQAGTVQRQRAYRIGGLGITVKIWQADSYCSFEGRQGAAGRVHKVGKVFLEGQHALFAMRR
jgi:hypothetical protein